VEVAVDVFNQSQSLDHQVHCPDAATVHCCSSLRHLVTDVAGLEHWAKLVFPVLGRQTLFDSALAITEDLRIASIHSKWPFVGCGCGCDKLNSTSIYGHFEYFLLGARENHTC
jgi:hypothetical protein